MPQLSKMITRSSRLFQIAFLLILLTLNSRISLADSSDATLDTPVATASCTTGSEVVISWRSVNGASSYTIERSQDGVSWIKVGGNVGGNIFYDRPAFDTNAPQAGGLYYYRVRAVAAGGQSEWCAPLGVLTQIRTVSVAPYFWRVKLDWNPVYGSTGYLVQRRTASSNSFSTITPKSITESAFDDTTAIGGATYVYRVCAVVANSHLQSPWSQTVTAKPYAGIDCGSSKPNMQARYPFDADTVGFGGTKQLTESGTLGGRQSGVYSTWRVGARYEPITYSVPAPNGSYFLSLMFAEIGLAKPGQRMFDIVVNGVTMNRAFDIIGTAGNAGTSIDLRFPVSITNNLLTVRLAPSPGSLYGPAINGLLLTPKNAR